MPLYTYTCHECGRETDEFRTVATRRRGPRCHGRTMSIVLQATQIQAEIPAYVSPASGKLITSRRERREDLAATRSRPWEGFESESKEAARRKAEADAKLEQSLEKTARELFHALPSDKRRQLESAP